MKETEASRSAIITSIFRAAHQIFDDNPKILEDPISIGLVEGSSENEIKKDVNRIQSPIAKHMRSLFVLRGRFTEDQLDIAVKSGIQQYIILGAGFDTFAFRQPNWSKSLQIIEIDHPDSQKTKLLRLEKKGIKIPSNLKFISVDFETDSIQQKLDENQVNKDLPTFFSWLGVTQYLSDEAIENTLRFVSSYPRSSRISFTIVLPISKLTGIDAEVHALVSERAASFGEPWISVYDPIVFVKRLKEMGFSEIIHLTPEAASKIYFDNRTDGLVAPIGEQCICAIV